MVTVTVNDAILQMEVDTGATLPIISESTYKKLWLQQAAPPLKPANAKLKMYTGEQISVKGKIEVDVTYQEQKQKLALPSLLG